ncbi:unnamed protein product [Hermetia illucens]|uniref:Uncharacterized protein n=1 Tax=Hermetia illucens TaxID=343691 RepID=A0A7R8YTN4_HERIL|nr:unnamed protein product [Hermetia illucens]
MPAYTRRKANSKYKNRIRLERASQQQSNGINKTPYDRVKQGRQRKIMNAADRINDGAGTAGTAEIMQIGDENASTSTSDCVGVDCVRSSFMKTQQLVHVSLRRLSTIHSDTSVMCVIVYGFCPH